MASKSSNPNPDPNANPPTTDPAGPPTPHPSIPPPVILPPADFKELSVLKLAYALQNCPKKEPDPKWERGELKFSFNVLFSILFVLLSLSVLQSLFSILFRIFFVVLGPSFIYSSCVCAATPTKFK